MAMLPAAVGRTGIQGVGLGLTTAFCGAAGLSYSTTKGDVRNPQVGEGWSIAIRSALPGARVSVYGSPAAGSGQLVETLEGYTDSNGYWSKTGQFTQDQIGSWAETWKVGGAVVGTWNFVVRAPVGDVPPAALLKPMPTIIPAKPGQVSSGQLGPLCALDGWVYANPFGGVLLALGVGYLLKRGFK